MPRKAPKTEKPPLLFLERALCGARLQNVPEVRAALNPREFFTEKHEDNSSALISWVSPQFDSTLPAAPPVRRGRRRKCQSVTSILDSSTQLTRKTSVCKFPSLSFHTKSRDQPHQPKSTRRKKATDSTDVKTQAQGSRQVKRTVSSGEYSETPKRPIAIRKRSTEGVCDAAASVNGCLNGPEIPSIQVPERCIVPADGASVLALNEFSTTEVSSIAPDVDTPKVIQEGISCSSSASLHLLLLQPCTPTRSQPPEVLVADTPERDYGVKVTWRRRRGLMLLLKERGHLTEPDVLIHC
ncbi:RAD9, HUS1, RAD1-interacting nuclear orphan protein 1 [Cheilinus undulatus]|uniref:RAD9, HUS1, RAD1-interacting nuclear orphan protein 1 n=1 Tax=Cheilinus undulatus TaxID=241271 RepID=UPI001BD3FEA2|nr:RAD9, HUS1, RAD1-interacting nuclear orphan protein 1 [Cheilinus undulatus]